MLAMVDSTTIDAGAIRRAERLIRPHIRRTPVMTVDAADFGLASRPLVLKLELLQHAGSFKPRGAFTNLLTRHVPAAGVVAASGGNHGAAVAYAAKRLGHKATIFVPGIASPAKLDRIRSYGAELVVAGERYVEALAASEEFAAKTGALAGACLRPARDADRAGHARAGARGAGDGPRHAARRGRRRRADRRRRRLVSRPRENRRRSSRRRRRRCTWRCRPASRSTRRPAASPPIRSRRSRSGSSCFRSRKNSSSASCWSRTITIRSGAARALGQAPDRERAGRRGGLRGAPFRPLPAAGGRARRNRPLRRQYRARWISAADAG